MHRARYWLLLKIAQNPNTVTRGVGLLVSIILVTATFAATILVDRAQVARGHNNSLIIFEEMMTEAEALLAHLHTHDEPDCSPANLLHFNAHLVQSMHIREIGFMGPDRELICSTALGPLDTPIKGNHRVYVTASGFELLKDVPLAVAENELTAIIIQSHPFNVVLSPYGTRNVTETADAVWLRTENGLTQLSPAADERRAQIRLIDEDSKRDSYFDLQGLGYELISTTPESDIVLQTLRSASTIFGEGRLLFISLFTGSLLIGILTSGTIRPYIFRLGDVRHRIAFLCDESHLALVYQPIFDLATLEPMGCEVLARLKEGDRLWMPKEFITAIREAGLESRFDLAVTRRAIQELGDQLPLFDEPFTVALNYFPRSVNPDSLVPVIDTAMKATGRSDLEICLEVTEHDLSSGLFAEVRALKRKGFSVAIDDFGTGYSNLQSVTRLAPDHLKIDGSFVYDLEEASVRSSLVPEIVNIARAVQAHTIAEGIEKMEQAHLLCDAGVRYGQGYALARPMPIEEFVRFIAEGERYDGPEA